MIANALICYAVAFIIPVAALILLFKFSKGRLKLSPLHMIIGCVSFFASVAGMLYLLMFAFSETSVDYMNIYMPEWLYKVLVALLFFAVLCALRYFILNAVYFTRDREEKGTSFLVGFGMSGGIAISLYCLFSFLYIAFTALSADFIELTSESVLQFSDSTVIPVFYPFWPHIVLSALFVVYAAFMLVQSYFMTQHANLPYKWNHTLIMYLLTSGCETCMLSVMLLSVAHINIVAILVISAVLAILAGLCVKLLYKYKEELPYDKQFN